MDSCNIYNEDVSGVFTELDSFNEEIATYRNSSLTKAELKK
jgi:hypothetical protein